jgi:mono/diheme cytochrome c family protein
MYTLWGFPFDKATRTSAAPRPLMRLHRLLGYTYVVLYLIMMSQMVPRMWQYQVELPPRTVAHLLLGFLIGIILLLKIAILRFFRHFEEWMPTLGTLLFVCTVLLLGLSLPTAYREGRLASGVYSAENRKRVADLLPNAGLPPGTPLTELSTESGLRAGRAVLLDKCVRCHDLKTVLTQPRTPSDWVTTVSRMVEKPTLFAPITEREQQTVSAYLIAITPDLQKSMQSQLQQAQTQLQTQRTIEQADTKSNPEGTLAAAQATFQRICSQCHATGEVDKSPPRTEAEVQSMLLRMNKNGMKATESEIRSIRAYLTKTYVKSL